MQKERGELRRVVEQLTNTVVELHEESKDLQETVQFLDEDCTMLRRYKLKFLEERSETTISTTSTPSNKTKLASQRRQ
jgi:hypothetical protein